MAVPTEARETSSINSLRKGLGKIGPIDLQGVSGRVAQTFEAQRAGHEPAPNGTGKQSATVPQVSAESPAVAIPEPGLHDPGNGQRLTIDALKDLSPREREVVRRSEAAYRKVRMTWELWKVVREGLVVLRALAMRETGSDNVLSKRYKNRFHHLIQGRSYHQMGETTRKVLLQCADLAPAIDEWHAKRDEEQKLRLNHPERVLRAFRKAHEPKSTSTPSRQSRHEAELEAIRKEAAAAVSNRDVEIVTKNARIQELEERLRGARSGPIHLGTSDKPLKSEDAGADNAKEPDSDAIVHYVVANCRSAEKIREVIRGLEAYLERHAS